MGNKFFWFTQGKFSPANAWKDTGLHQGVNPPVDSGGFYFGLKLFVKLHNVFICKGAFAFEMILQFSDIQGFSCDGIALIWNKYKQTIFWQQI